MNPFRWAWLDGRLLPVEEAVVPALDRGFLMGDGAFEVLRTYGGRPLRLAAHLDRLDRSLAALGIPLPCARADLEKGIDEIVRRAAPDDLSIRITVSRGPGGEGYLPPPPGAARGHVFVHGRPVPDVAALRAKGLTAIVGRRRRVPVECLDPAWKTTSGLPLVLARREAAEAGADEAILLNLAGEVAEGSHTNVFVVRGGRILTPPLGAGILEGVTRSIVLETSEVEERPLRPDDLRSAEEAFLAYTSAGPVPLVEVDGRPVGRGRAAAPGIMTRGVLERFDALVRRECGAA